MVNAALDAGVNFFDTARSYGGGRSEEFLGKALGAKRPAAIIATKVGSPMEKRLGPWGRGSRRYILEATETCLRALGTDWIDVLQLHAPDLETPIDETLEAFDTLVRQGKVRYLGCSNFNGWMVADASWTARTRGLHGFVSLQNEWSLVQRDIEREVVGACERFGLGVLPFFPLASGVLTGKYRKGEPPPPDTRLAKMPFASRFASDPNLDAVARLESWATERGRSLTEVALSWLASHPQVSSVIAGATSGAQVAENAAATKVDLSAEERKEIGALVSPVT